MAARTKGFFRPTNLWRLAGVPVIASGVAVWKFYGTITLTVMAYKTDVHTALFVTGIALLLWPMVQEGFRVVLALRTGKDPGAQQ